MPDNQGILQAETAGREAAHTAGRLRLAAVLADMLPGARVIRVTTSAPGHPWPALYARAYAEHGRPIPMPRPKAVAAARWIARAHPEVAACCEPQDFDLHTGVLTPVIAAVRADGQV